MRGFIVALWAALGFVATAQAQEPNAAPWMAIVAPDNSFNFNFYRNGRAVLSSNVYGWGPNWGWRSFGARARVTGDELNVAAPFEADKAAGQIINAALSAKKTGARTLQFRFDLSAERDAALTALVAGFKTEKEFQDGQVTLTGADGKTTTWPLSLSGIRGAGPTSKIAFQSKTAGEVSVVLDPPVAIGNDNGMRILLAEKTFPAGRKSVTLTLNFPEDVALVIKDADMARLTQTLPTAEWYPFAPGQDLGPSTIGFEEWLEKPAGRRGGVRQRGEGFVFEDGTPVKFWGTNLSYTASAPEKAQADAAAARFAKWGVNAVRMHKFTGSGWEGIGDPNDATKMEARGLEKLDYFSAQLTKSGVYYGWSHTYHFKVKPGNRNRLLAYDEIEKNLKGDTYAFINIAEDVQDLLIESVVNLLKHQNAFTGKTYAQDPALCFIELQNEDDIFFYTNESALNACPTYKKRFIDRYCQWLTKKYGTTAALKTAWGNALNANETLEAKNIALQGNPWFFGEDNLPRQTGGARQRLLDNAAFFHFAQNQFYGRFVKAIRDAGYQGPIVGSPWQAPAMLPHYYNLKSDALAGYIDRHNYFGGGLNDTMLTQPGSGYFSSGLQQVAGLPFGLSEWIHVYPSLYSAEGPPLLAAYGMGLQGWDASYQFQSNTNALWSEAVGTFPWGVWNADVPNQIGQYPLLARMVMRGDVQQGDVISVRRVSDENLAKGEFNFSDKVQQSGDVKTFGGSTPAAALAAGRCLVEFTPATQNSTFPDMDKYKVGSVIKANNDQLSWDTAGRGYFTINTAGTKGVVGFAGEKEIALGDVKIALPSPYASLLVTATDKTATLATAKSALISAFARNSNSGFSIFTPDKRVLNNGKGPILLEPVKATLTFTRAVAAVNLLDHDGVATGRTIPVAGNSITIDGARDKTPFYEVVFR